MAGYVAAAGQIIGAAGNIAGPLIGNSQQLKSSDMRLPTFSPAMDPYLAASAFDSAGYIGFADANMIPDPFEDMANRISMSSMDEKNKRRALIELAEFKEDIRRRWDDQLDKPPKDVFERAQHGDRDAIKEVEKYEKARGEVLSKPRFSYGGKPLREAMGRLGVTFDDLTLKFEDIQRRRDEVQRLRDAGFDGLQSDIITNRARAKADISDIAAGALRGGGSPIFDAYRDRLFFQRERDLEEARTAAELRGRFGGYNPSASLENLDSLQSRLTGDVDFDATIQALGLAGAVNQLMLSGTASAQGQAGISSSANTNALSIAANQANAANALLSQSGMYRGDSLANGIATAANSIGNAGILIADAYRNQNTPPPGGQQSVLGSGGTSPGWQGPFYTWPQE